MGDYATVVGNVPNTSRSSSLLYTSVDGLDQSLFTCLFQFSYLWLRNWSLPLGCEHLIFYCTAPVLKLPRILFCIRELVLVTQTSTFVRIGSTVHVIIRPYPEIFRMMFVDSDSHCFRWSNWIAKFEVYVLYRPRMWSLREVVSLSPAKVDIPNPVRNDGIGMNTHTVPNIVVCFSPNRFICRGSHGVGKGALSGTVLRWFCRRAF